MTFKGTTKLQHNVIVALFE